MYYIYMLRCNDNSLYTGITNHLEKRLDAHFLQKRVAAKYTKSRRAISVEAVWKTKTKSDALKLEARIKKLSKAKKEKLIANYEMLSVLFEDFAHMYEYIQKQAL